MNTAPDRCSSIISTIFSQAQSCKCRLRISVSTCWNPAQFDRSEHVLQLFEQAWSKGDTAVLDEVMAEGHIQRDMIWGGAGSEGRAALQKGVSAFRQFYPDLTFTIKTISPDPQQGICFVEWMAEGTYSGVLEGTQASDEKESFNGLSALTIKDSQIVETRVYRDAPKGEKAMFLRMASE